MSLTDREFWGVIHGMGLGALFLLAFAGGFAGLWGLRQAWVSSVGLRRWSLFLSLGTGIMAVVAWLTVITGTYIVYPWYRAAPPEGTTNLSGFAKALLISSEATAKWHEFGMEWKEHVGWIAPIAATVVAYVISVYGPKLVNEPKVRKALTWFFVTAFTAAGIAGVLGAFITKAAPVR